MVQVTLRVPKALQERLRIRAREQGISVNEWANKVLEAATNPDLATSEAARVRERLAAAGLLEKRPPSSRSRPPRDEVAAAMRAAGTGTPLSDLVSAGRK